MSHPSVLLLFHKLKSITEFNDLSCLFAKIALMKWDRDECGCLKKTYHCIKIFIHPNNKKVINHQIYFIYKKCFRILSFMIHWPYIITASQFQLIQAFYTLPFSDKKPMRCEKKITVDKGSAGDVNLVDCKYVAQFKQSFCGDKI